MKNELKQPHENNIITLWLCYANMKDKDAKWKDAWKLLRGILESKLYYCIKWKDSRERDVKLQSLYFKVCHMQMINYACKAFDKERI